MTDLSVHATALAGLTRRPTTADGNTIRNYFTHARYIELTAEADGVSAWAVGSIEIAGKLVSIAVYLGEALSPTDATRLLSRAKVLVAEAISAGSRRATFHGDGTMPNGQRVFLYAAPQLHEPLALSRVESFIDRNKLTMKNAETATAKKPLAKSTKAKAA